MREWIRRLDQWLRSHRPEYYARLLPGATDEELDQLERQVSRALPEAFRDLYRWRNGTPDDLETEALIHNYSFITVQESGQVWSVLKELLDSGDFDRPNWWRPGWIPILGSWGGDNVCVDLEGTFTGHSGQVLDFVHDDEGRDILAPSLDAWGETFVAGLAEGLWRDEDGDFHPVDDAQWREFQRRLLPGFPVTYSAALKTPIPTPDPWSPGVYRPWRHLIGNLCPDCQLYSPVQGQLRAAQHSLRIEVPPELRQLLLETNGVTRPDRTQVIWPAEMIGERNQQFRADSHYRMLYMPFDHLLFFGDNGRGDQFAYRIRADHQLDESNIYLWKQATDAREWYARGLASFLESVLTEEED